MSETKNAVIDDLNAMNDNLIPDIPIEVLYKYLLKDYRRQKQRNVQLEEQNESLLKRNSYLETEYGTMKNRLTKLTEKQFEYSKEFKELHQAISCRNNTISQLRTENAGLKDERTCYAEQVDRTE